MIIGVVSGKGGVGKTTIASNLSYYLSSLGKDVTLIDCNVTTSHLNFNFGLFTANNTINKILRGEKDFSEVIYKYKNLKIVPASLRLEDLEYVDLTQLKFFLKDLNSEFVFLDSAPGFGREAMSILTSVDAVLLVTTPFINSVADILRAKKILEALQKIQLGVVVNMVKGKSYELKKNEIEAITGIKVVGEVPYDENVEIALSKGKPFVELNPNSPASIAIKKVSNRIFGTPIEEERFSFREKIVEKIKKFGEKFRII
ncbi:MAG: P-loop NTPase [Candidatus Aenigmarchaeota archaeon]|nr:P-loop NTPase [Candidatus Aenigmarchaeota archaeon]MCX8190722.1 P-loop NTPase [Candidatus Aenigmarchaeota archaeon]MDW8159970.1 P-loop NTPase [Candidatus Aenigmarchaeota archaeon]